EDLRDLCRGHVALEGPVLLAPRKPADPGCGPGFIREAVSDGHGYICGVRRYFAERRATKLHVSTETPKVKLDAEVREHADALGGEPGDADDVLDVPGHRGLGELLCLVAADDPAAGITKVLGDVHVDGARRHLRFAGDELEFRDALAIEILKTRD